MRMLSPQYQYPAVTGSTHIKPGRSGGGAGGHVGGAAPQLLPEALGEGEEQAHGQDPGAHPLSLLGLRLLLLCEQLLQEGPA